MWLASITTIILLLHSGLVSLDESAEPATIPQTMTTSLDPKTTTPAPTTTTPEPTTTTPEPTTTSPEPTTTTPEPMTTTPEPTTTTPEPTTTTPEPTTTTPEPTTTTPEPTTTTPAPTTTTPEPTTTTPEPTTTTPEPTTTTPELITTTPEPTTTEGTSPTISPTDTCCDVFAVSPVYQPATMLPSQSANITASCTCKSDNESYCPLVDFAEEASGEFSYHEEFIEHARNICMIQMTIKPVLNQFNKRSIEIPLTVCAPGKENQLTLRFQKSGNEEPCHEDVDCWHKDQMCDNGRCSCYKDLPSFVKLEERCFSESSYGEMCKYDEQCMTKNNNTFCSDKSRCQCKDGYVTEKCLPSFTSKVNANQVLVYVTAISSMILFYLKI